MKLIRTEDAAPLAAQGADPAGFVWRIAPDATLALAFLSAQAPGFFPAAHARMSPARQEKCAAFLRAADRERCILADALGRRLVADRFFCAPETVRFGATEEGCPVCESHPVCVSFSHGGDAAAALVSPCPAGVDVEPLREVKAMAAKHFCTPRDLAYLLDGAPALPPGTLADPAVLRRFFRVWTFKEALGKQQGTGWTEAVKKTDFDPGRALFYETDTFCLCAVVSCQPIADSR